MAWVNPTRSWIRNSYYSLKANQFPHDDFFILELPLPEPIDEKEKEHQERAMKSIFKSSDHQTSHKRRKNTMPKSYTAVVLPSFKDKILPNYYHFTITSYSDFMNFNAKLKQNFNQIYREANYNLLEPPTKPEERYVEVAFMQSYPSLMEQWFRITPFRRGEYLFKYYVYNKPKPFAYVNNIPNNYVILGKIDLTIHKAKINCDKPPEPLKKAILWLLKKDNILKLMEDGYSYDVIFLKKSVTVYGMGWQKSNIIVKSMIPKSYIITTNKLLSDPSSVLPSLIDEIEDEEPPISFLTSSQISDTKEEQIISATAMPSPQEPHPASAPLQEEGEKKIGGLSAEDNPPQNHLL